MRPFSLAFYLFSVTAMLSSALALDLGVGGKGGVDIGGAVGGVTGGVGGGISVEVGTGGVSVEVGAQGGAGGTGGGGSQTGGSGTSGGGGQAGAGGAQKGTSGGLGRADAPEHLRLPFYLLPESNAGELASRPSPAPEVTGSVRMNALVSRPGTSPQVIASCREAIAAAASPYGAARVDVVSAGRSARMRGGGMAAPVEARIVYSRNGRFQVRQAEITCRLNASGEVVAAL